jgi:hypothetical protein
MKKDESLIPEGAYCYTIIKTPCKETNWCLRIKPCPYWKLIYDFPEQMNGYCKFLKEGDWTPKGLSLLCE